MDQPMTSDATQNPRADLEPLRRSMRERAFTSAELALALAELLRAGTLLPEALAAIAARRRQQQDTCAPEFERIAVGVTEEGRSLFEAIHAEKAWFTPRFMAVMALANLGGQVFQVFVGRLREWVSDFSEMPADKAVDFPPLKSEVREFCFLFGHLTIERVSQPEVQRWLPRVFTPKLRLPATHVLARFFDQGLLLSEAFERTPPFNDPEMVLAIQSGEALNRVGQGLLELADWLVERERLEERMRLSDWVVPIRPTETNPRAEASSGEKTHPNSDEP